MPLWYLIFGVIFSFLIASPVQAQNYFTFADNKLNINTSLMEMIIEGGAVVYIKDKASGEILVNTNAWTNRPTVSDGFMPSQSTAATFQAISSTQAKLTYPIGNNQLVLDINVDPAGEVIIQLSGLGAGRPNSINLPIMNIAQPGVILGSGAKYTRSDADTTAYSTSVGFESPVVAVVEGSRSVLAAWSETTIFPPQNIELRHRTAFDHLILHTGRDPKETNSQRIVSSPWRLGTYANWVKAAKRWRVKFEERTGARPLWNNSAPWVRKVHAVYRSIENYLGTTEDRYRQLEAITGREKLLFNMWNGDRIVLFGDHRLAAVIDRPKPGEVEMIHRFGWPVILYHPYTLFYNETGSANRLAELSGKGWLPAGYSFNPDYEGTPGNWYSYWSDTRTKYFDGSIWDIMHPGSTKFKNYLVRNFKNYLAYHGGADGAYFDITGYDHGFLFSNNNREGQDWILGEAKAFERLKQELPNKGVMSEYQGQWIMPYIFYTWQGVWRPPSRINHPLRVALTGSYSWTREDNREDPNDVVSALLGGLPAVSLVGDYGVSQARALWSQQRAKLFTDQELFYDVPDNWDPAALAYYRSKSGHWFKYKKVGSTYAYVEELPNGQEVVRLVEGGTYSTPTPGPPRTPTPTPPSSLPGDLDRDGDVDIYDYNRMVSDFGKTGSPGWIAADIDKNGKVDIYDYNVLVENFGKRS